VTAADIMMHFSARFILARKLGTQGEMWPRVEMWLNECEALPAYQRAVEKTGHRL
jgi:glutathione S-transferase